jgi:hypothetical protein
VALGLVVIAGVAGIALLVGRRSAEERPLPVVDGAGAGILVPDDREAIAEPKPITAAVRRPIEAQPPIEVEPPIQSEPPIEPEPEPWLEPPLEAEPEPILAEAAPDLTDAPPDLGWMPVLPRSEIDPPTFEPPLSAPDAPAKPALPPPPPPTITPDAAAFAARVNTREDGAKGRGDPGAGGRQRVRRAWEAHKGIEDAPIGTVDQVLIDGIPRSWERGEQERRGRKRRAEPEDEFEDD